MRYRYAKRGTIAYSPAALELCTSDCEVSRRLRLAELNDSS